MCRYSYRPSLAFCAMLCAGLLSARQLAAQQPEDYSPARFGPHALPVPEMSDGKIPEHTIAGLSSDYSFGHGDRTVGVRLDVEVPLVPKHVSFKLWYDVHEWYSLSDEVSSARGIETSSPGGRLRGNGGGDVYVQTRMSILGERHDRPAIILASTLKTASGGGFAERRFYDTPGYWFDVQVAKSFRVRSDVLKDVRLVGGVGFLCWETTGSVQNDAPMYGLNVILSNDRLSFENQIGGYVGWMDNGDRPLSVRSKLAYRHKNLDLFVQYQYGIVDFPYHQIRVGLSVSIPALTPRYR